MYVNGVQQTFTGSDYPSQNATPFFNTALEHFIGRYANQFMPTGNFNGYMTEINFIDGQALTPSSFGQTNSATGVWEPIKYTGTYGTNGFFLQFADNSGTTSTTLGKDTSGNGNNWTPNNFSVTAGAGNDSLVDSPTQYGTDTGAGGEVRGNYATWNPLINGDSAANGNLDVTNDTARSTQTLLQFDTYWEITSTGGTTTAGTVSSTGTTNTTTIANGKTYGFRLTAAGTLDYINITDAGSFTNITTGLTGQQFIYASAASATTGSLNTGQRPFAATAPSGFKALVTTNLPTPTIGATSTTQANDYFNTVLYTGTGSSLGVTGVGFQPDWVWIKERSGAADHGLYDAVRGVQKQLESNTATAETTESTGLTAFGTDGFTVGALAQLNTNTDTYVAWNWKGNGAGSSNTAGTISSTVSANTTAGFSIVSYTGDGNDNATVGHGLGVTPSMIIVRRRSGDDWYYYQTGLTSISYGLRLNKTDAESSNTSTVKSLSSTTFTLGTDGMVNVSSNTYIAYVFAAVTGYSAFGSYTGNGSSDGPFIYTGFRPKYVLIKPSSAVDSWQVEDAARSPFNVVNDQLWPNLSDAEQVDSATRQTDFVSNGFKIRGTNTGVNGNGTTYIYAAFAEFPFKYTLAR
jgi:hypothetical protein